MRRARSLAQAAGRVIAETSLGSQLTGSGRPTRRLACHFNNLVGDSPAMFQVYEATRRAASTSATVLVRSESGTGREAIARAVHFSSTRRQGPFVG